MSLKEFNAIIQKNNAKCSFSYKLHVHLFYNFNRVVRAFNNWVSFIFSCNILWLLQVTDCWSSFFSYPLVLDSYPPPLFISSRNFFFACLFFLFSIFGDLGFSHSNLSLASAGFLLPVAYGNKP